MLRVAQFISYGSLKELKEIPAFSVRFLSLSCPFSFSRAHKGEASPKFSSVLRRPLRVTLL